MELNNRQIVELYEGLINLREGRSEALPIKVGFAIIKDTKILEPIYKSIITMRDDIIFKNGDIGEEGQIQVRQENIDSVNKQLAELSEINNSIDLDRIPLSALAAISLSLDDINTLYPIINGEE